MNKVSRIQSATDFEWSENTNMCYAQIEANYFILCCWMQPIWTRIVSSLLRLFIKVNYILFCPHFNDDIETENSILFTKYDAIVNLIRPKTRESFSFQSNTKSIRKTKYFLFSIETFSIFIFIYNFNLSICIYIRLRTFIFFFAFMLLHLWYSQWISSLQVFCDPN